MLFVCLGERGEGRGGSSPVLLPPLFGQGHRAGGCGVCGGARCRPAGLRVGPSRWPQASRLRVAVRRSAFPGRAGVVSGRGGRQKAVPISFPFVIVIGRCNQQAVTREIQYC